ncbi:UDP-3-O-(3-hydroxymyristoyl)glucosamine N-acyltransferase [Psychrosphaera aestuarii]|uniref:UDP-3-O-(3-hydroxymyristoyl)glucosamine N-acyltransferase n=1 Tax=Psychrosphaera aestuarii TaxID=1266052 RepID=UPI001B32BB6F|nr:UDP-3-O-(3-hydroxymyristoyl)glucosamine N-acyltransferase [Psychrosphaera aestuarii]
MKYTLKELAAWVANESGIEVSIKGNADLVIHRIATIEGASGSDITFLANKKYAKHLTTSQAGCVILAPDMVDSWSKDALVMENPYVGFALIAQKLDTTPQQIKTIAPSAIIGETATIGCNVAIGANVVIEDGAEIGDDVQIGAGCFIGQGTILGAGTRLWPNVTVYHNVTFGSKCMVQGNSVIGADGFGYAPLQENNNQKWIKIPQLGGVSIGDGTEIGANTTIDRGAIADTKIGKGVILDNQIQIGHNVEIGDYTAIAAGTLIAGSTKVGHNVTIGGGVGIAGHLNICDRAFITGRTFVINDIMEPGVYSSGMPATTNKEWRNNAARYRKLTELFSRVKTLEKQIQK